MLGVVVAVDDVIKVIRCDLFCKSYLICAELSYGLNRQQFKFLVMIFLLYTPIYPFCLFIFYVF